jgi:putative phage-type endonuclease
MEQRTDEWWSARRGKITASRIGDVVARNQPKKGQSVGDWSARRNNYLAEKVAERITGKNRDRRKVASLDHRVELEPDARAEYEFYYEAEIQVVGFIDHPRIPMAGASPDGLVGDEGGVEIKCCDAEGHIEIIKHEFIAPDYLYQIHFNMACTDRMWWDFIAFNPDMPPDGRLFVKRVERDETIISWIEDCVIEFNAEVDRKVEEALAAMRGSTVLETQLAASLTLVH